MNGIGYFLSFADKWDLWNRFGNSLHSGFSLAFDVSAYWFIAVAGWAVALINSHGGSIVTLTCLGCEKVAPNCNDMGVAMPLWKSQCAH